MRLSTATSSLPVFHNSNDSSTALRSMSRRDIAVILERLTLDHRASLAEKACAYLQAVESNGAIRNHPSHAAICVDIAANQLSIEVSRKVLVSLSGAASPIAYNNAYRTLAQHLTDGTSSSKQHDQQRHVPETRSQGLRSAGALDMDLDNNSSHGQIRQLISTTSQTYLRQMAVQYGSIELDELVLEALERFFPVWSNTLAPAQRAYVKYSDPKWVGAGFWLCAMARNMTVDKSEKQDTLETRAAGTRAGAGTKAAIEKKKIGGRGGKELKEMILTAMEHRIQKTELDKAIDIMEGQLQEFLTSLGKPKGGRRRGGGGSSAPSTPVKQKVASKVGDSTHPDGDKDENLSLSSGLTRTLSTTTTSASRSRPSTRHPSAFAGLSAKRQISNVSQVSMASEADDDQGQIGIQEVTEAAESSATRPSKRKKLDPQEVQPSSADIMSSKKKPSSRSLKETTAASQDANRLPSKRRKTGGVYSMIPRVKYEDTKAYAHYQEWSSRILKSLASKG